MSELAGKMMCSVKPNKFVGQGSITGNNITIDTCIIFLNQRSQLIHVQSQREREKNIRETTLMEKFSSKFVGLLF